MYDSSQHIRQRQTHLDGPIKVTAEARAESALRRARRVKDEWTPTSSFDLDDLRSSLEARLEEPTLERERLFLLGWLHWRAGEPERAEQELVQALAQTGVEDQGEPAYWLARSRLLLNRSVIGDYETVLRQLRGDPQATCWFVDLLWRSGQIERAEQIWKALRGNQRAQELEEFDNLEAKSLIHRGELGEAMKLLQQREPDCGALQAERWLLLCWASAAEGRLPHAREHLEKAEKGHTPPGSLRLWHLLLDLKQEKCEPSSILENLTNPKYALTWREAQDLRGRGDSLRAQEMLEALDRRELLEPFVSYALACLGHGDFSELMARKPGGFLAVRCRLRLAIQKFCQRSASAEELLSALRQAKQAGYRARHLESLEQFATLLGESSPPESLWLSGDPNRRRVALTQFVRQANPNEGIEQLLEWSQSSDLESDAPLRERLARHLLRWLLIRDGGTPSNEEVQNVAKSLLGPSPLPILVDKLLKGDLQRAPGEIEGFPSCQHWRAVTGLITASTAEQRQAWRAKTDSLAQDGSGRGVALILLAYESAHRRDLTRLTEILEKPGWRTLTEGPPTFLIQAIRSASAARRDSPPWQATISKWLSSWDESQLSSEALSLRSGEVESMEEASEEMCLHQASRAWHQGQMRRALGWVKKTSHTDALDDLQKLARAEQLAQVIHIEESHPSTSPSLLIGFCEDLLATPEGEQLFEHADAQNVDSARSEFLKLTEKKDLPPTLAHALGLTCFRIADAYEQEDKSAEAIDFWSRCWNCWTQWMATADAESVTVLRDHLLNRHRQMINDLLTRGSVDRARRYWTMWMALPEPIQSRVLELRTSMSMDHLLRARQLMKTGEIAEGMRFNYEQGLLHLRKVLSLDRENKRLLTVLVEICNDWFLDLYDNEDFEDLRSQLERFTPLALQLAKMIQGSDKDSDLEAKSALSELYKFRGFIASSKEERISHYREALKFNPGNENVRDLLSQLGEQP